MESASTLFLDSLYKSSSNQEFLEALEKFEFIQELNKFMTDLTEFTLDQIKTQIQTLAEGYKKSPKEYLDLIKGLFTFYIRENITGPSLYSLYVEEEKRPLIKGEPLRTIVYDPLSNKNEKLQETLGKHFEKDGEQIYQKSQFLVLFYAIEVLLETQPEQFNDEDEFYLWKARFNILYDKQLTSNVVHLQDESIALYEKYINSRREKLDMNQIQNKRDVAVLLVEQSYCYLNFYKYKKSKQSLKEAMKLLNLNLKLTGRLGRRTKYQEFDIAQLVLDVQNREVQVKEVKPAEETEQSQNVLLEEESILYEKPKITDPLGELPTQGLSVEDQIVIEAYAHYIMKTYPTDETRMELLRPYILAVLEKSLNWLVYSKGLLLRSRNELEKTKTAERAVLQIQALIDQFKDKQPTVEVKQQFVFATDYPFYWQLMRELAKNYMKMGVFVSAYELLKEVELYEDCILSLFMAGRTTQAEQLATEQLQKFESPAILCLLGDIKKDPSYYEKAWEVSNKKFARAMRSLARQYYFRGEYKQAIDCYEQALAINRLYADSWFTLGCAYMRLEDWKGAIYSFGVSISIDDQNAEGWTNISNCYLRLDQYNEAIVCLEQALKQNRKSWQIWENYIILSLETLKFHKAISGARELMRQEKFDRLNVSLMLKICDVFLKNYVAKPVAPNELTINKKQLYTFFDEYTAKVAKDWQVWRLIGRVKGILQEPVDELKELKLKEIRSLMVINWEHEIETCEKIERGLEELLKIAENGALSEEQKVFVKNTAKAIKACLQRECKVKLE